MPTYEKIQCPYGCGMEVSSMPGPMAMHKKKYHPDACPPDSEPVSPVVTGNPPQQNEADKETPVVAKVNDNVDPKIKDLLMKAKAAQDTFKKAPRIFVSGQTSDEMLELRKMYLPESLGNNPSVHCFFDLESRLEQDAARGYSPVIHPMTGGFVRFNELIMLKLPIEMHRAMEKNSQEASRAKVKRAADPNHTGGADAKLTGGEPVSGVGLRVEEFSTEQVKLG